MGKRDLEREEHAQRGEHRENGETLPGRLQMDGRRTVAPHPDGVPESSQAEGRATLRPHVPKLRTPLRQPLFPLWRAHQQSRAAQESEMEPAIHARSTSSADSNLAIRG